VNHLRFEWKIDDVIKHNVKIEMKLIVPIEGNIRMVAILNSRSNN